MKDIEAEIAKLKRMYADLALEHRALDGPDRKKARRPPEQRAVIKYIREPHGLSVVCSCKCVGLAHSGYDRAPRD